MVTDISATHKRDGLFEYTRLKEEEAVEWWCVEIIALCLLVSVIVDLSREVEDGKTEKREQSRSDELKVNPIHAYLLLEFVKEALEGVDNLRSRTRDDIDSLIKDWWYIYLESCEDNDDLEVVKDQLKQNWCVLLFHFYSCHVASSSHLYVHNPLQNTVQTYLRTRNLW